MVAELAGGVIDVGSTPEGWRVIAANPFRVVELRGAFEIESVTGLPDMKSPGFAAPDVLAYLAPSPELESVDVPWTARHETVEGDLSLHLTNRGISALGWHLEVTIRNEGATNASGLYVSVSSTLRIDVPDLPPGGVAKLEVVVPIHAYDRRIQVLAEGVTDVDPSNNVATAEESERAPRRRGVTR